MFFFTEEFRLSSGPRIIKSDPWTLISFFFRFFWKHERSFVQGSLRSLRRKNPSNETLRSQLKETIKAGLLINVFYAKEATKIKQISFRKDNSH